MKCLLQWTVLMSFTLLMFTRPSWGAGMLIADGGNGGVLEIKEHTVNVTINNGIAVTEVTQVFLNTEDPQVEALYTFPVPRGASVSNFSMWINGKEMIGEVLEKKKAREIYESYKQTRRDPGLLEQVDIRTFEMRVFPIGPRAEQKVQVVYHQELEFDHDWARYVYPLASSTRKNVDQRATGKFALNVEVKSQVPITAMESTSHPKDFAIAKHSDNYHQASLETRGGDLSRDVVISYHTARPHTGIDLIPSRVPGEDGYFSLTLTAGNELAERDLAMDYVFVLDISGSMDNDGKLNLSRKTLGAFLNALSRDDRFEMLTFNVQANAHFKALKGADDAAKAEAMKFLDAQEARGGTVLAPALNSAYRYADPDRPLNVVLLSDGLTEESERAGLIQLIRNRPANARVFCIGVGNDVNRALLEQVAKESGGLAAFLSREDSFERAAQAFRRKLMRPAATEVKLEVAGVDAYDIEPRELGNLNHGMPVRMYGRYRTAGPAQVTLSALVAGKELKQSVNVEFPAEDRSNPQVERMWAWRRVDGLLKQADAAGSRKGVIEDVVRLGEGYSIATEYTSFIVLENDAEYQRWRIDRRNALRMTRDRDAAQALAMNLESIRAKAAADIGPVERPILAAAPVAKNNAFPTAQAPAATPGANRDVNLFGGGAIDPATILMVLGAAALAMLAGVMSKAQSRVK